MTADNVKIPQKYLFSVIAFLIISIGGILNTWYQFQFDEIRIDIKQLSEEAKANQVVMTGILASQNTVLGTMQTYIDMHKK